MATRISVTVKGQLGLDDPDELLAELANATGAPWSSRAVDQGAVLIGGVAEIVLVAVVGKGTEIAVGAAVDQVRAAVARWRRGRLDPPETEIREEPLPDEADGVDEAGGAEPPGGAEGAGD
ncbi:hypothetical protein [Kitasatospora viridis]|uniref:Uncharacterized protein n=1 Tax=Kitasatospora viridis TaxID=281105 RepID=A0A561SFG9_9ACTN|nr:hypothetical protein [Kitasatospora viridis]TWF73621.1 hypothetical protein FHX73_15234 [Kitasatospora viridis]